MDEDESVGTTCKIAEFIDAGKFWCHIQTPPTETININNRFTRYATCIRNLSRIAGSGSAPRVDGLDDRTSRQGSGYKQNSVLNSFLEKTNALYTYCQGFKLEWVLGKPENQTRASGRQFRNSRDVKRMA